MPPPHIQRRAKAQAPPAAAHTGLQAWATAAAAASAVTTPPNQQEPVSAHATYPPLNRNLVNQGGAAAGVNSEAAAATPGK